MQSAGRLPTCPTMRWEWRERAFKMAFVSCPQCGSKHLRFSKIRGVAGKLRSIVGIVPFRCRKCEHRFDAAIWSLSALRYARCPKCLRMELSTWSEQYYHPPASTVIKLRFGATPYRCEFCRCNFASFRACKERFSWRRRRQQAQGQAQAQENESAGS